MGLILNTSKCELIAHQGVSFFCRISDCSHSRGLIPATLLFWALRCFLDQCSTVFGLVVVMTSREQLAGCILFVLSRCTDPDEVVFQCTKSSSPLAVLTFDFWFISRSIRFDVEITNCDLSDMRWIQASLPVKDGGLGWDACLRSHFLPFWLQRRATSTLSLQNDIQSGCSCSDSVFLQSYLTDWLTFFGAIPDTLPPKQPFWNRPGILADQAQVKSSLSTQLELAFFMAASSSHKWELAFRHAHIIMWSETRRRCELESVCDLVWPFVFHISATVGLRSMHLAFMVLSVRRPQADQAGIAPWMTWLPEPWPLPESRSQRNLKVLAVQTERGQTVFSLIPWQIGKPPTWDVTVMCHWPIRTLLQQPERQAQ